MSTMEQAPATQSASLAARPSSRRAPLRERLCGAFQAINLLAALTAEENFALPLALAGRHPNQQWHRARATP
jgi:predicted ABC-type transport system involved in lysophospholipase L1 biosynthesis ATPase subunit